MFCNRSGKQVLLLISLYSGNRLPGQHEGNLPAAEACRTRHPGGSKQRVLAAHRRGSNVTQNAERNVIVLGALASLDEEKEQHLSYRSNRAALRQYRAICTSPLCAAADLQY